MYIHYKRSQHKKLKNNQERKLQPNYDRHVQMRTTELLPFDFSLRI